MSFITRSYAKSVVNLKEINAPFKSSQASATATSKAIGDDRLTTLLNANKIASDLATTLATKIADDSLKESKSLPNKTDDINDINLMTAVITSTSSSSSTSTTSTTTTTNAIPWTTDGTILQYNNNGTYENYIIKGFSLSGTEYIGSLFATTAYYDFGYYTYNSSNNSFYTYFSNGTISNAGNSGITLNTYYLMENIVLNVTAPNVSPMIRIPVCADYWLNGTANSPAINSSTSPYFTPGQTNVSFPPSKNRNTEYQQFIIDFIYYCYQTWTNAKGSSGPPITFIIDLHWNYVAQQPETSGLYPDTSSGKPNYSYSTLSSKQLPLSGVAVNDTSGGSSNLNLTDNTLDFWNSISSLFGVNADGNAIGVPLAFTYSNGSPSSYFTKSSGTTALPTVLLQNIFFELYNEPFTDELYTNGTSYSNKYSYYVNGGSNVKWKGNAYNFTGFGQMYNTIRQTNGAQNICIIAGSDSYAFMNFNTTSGNGQWDTSTNSINTNTYNCFTTLSDNIQNGTIYTSSSDTSSYFDKTNFYNVLINLHPYVGLYSGGLKHPGYYDESYFSDTSSSSLYTSNIPIPGFGQIVAALQTIGTSFYVGCPNICTEYGGYDLPWSSYSTSPTNSATSYQYSDAYFTSGETVNLVGQSNYGLPYYNGNYVDASGNNSSVPGIIGYLTDFVNLNVSFCVWAIRPNSGGNGQIINSSGSYSANSWILSNNNPSNYSWGQDTNAWAAYQPDVICGSANSYINFQNGESATSAPSTTLTPPSSTLYFSLISSSNQDLSGNTASNNYGSNGADFQYIFDNFYNTT